jgi:hypothetical protein
MPPQRRTVSGCDSLLTGKITGNFRYYGAVERWRAWTGSAYKKARQWIGQVERGKRCHDAIN